MALNQITLDGVVTESEADELVDRFNGACENAIQAVQNKENEIQSAFMQAFSVDGVIDENEQILLDFFAEETTANLEHLTSMQSEVNELRRKMREEGYEFTDADSQLIAEYYAAVLQAELEANASNQTELLYSQNQFKERVKTMDAESASEMLVQRREQYDEEVINNNAYYDTLIQQMQNKMGDMDSVQKAAAEEQIKIWEQQKLDQNKTIEDMWNQDIQTTRDSNENLIGIINKFNGEIVKAGDEKNYKILENASNNYSKLNEVTKTGYEKLYNETTKTWDDVYVKIDETTGKLAGIYDLNTQDLGAMTADNASLLDDEVTAWKDTTEGILANLQITGDGYVDLAGNIRDASGNIVAKLIEVKDANGNVKESIVDLNGNPVKITGNWVDAINKANEVNNAIQSIKNKTVTISVNQVGYANVKGSGYTPMYATGTENAMQGVASVAEYGPELIVSRSGAMALATERSLYNLEGGETVYNARQTQEILSKATNNNSQEKETSKLLQTVITKLDDVKKTIERKELSNVTTNNFGGVEVNGVSDIRELIEEITEYTEDRML